MDEIDKIMELGKFFSVGAITTLLDWIIFIILNGITGYMSAVIVSFGSGAILNYYLNRKFTFRANNNLFYSLIVFLIFLLIAYVITIVLMYLFIDIWHWNAIVSRILTTIVVFVYNYTVHSKITFK